jgi:hypothetical protein
MNKPMPPAGANYEVIFTRRSDREEIGWFVKGPTDGEAVEQALRALQNDGHDPADFEEPKVIFVDQADEPPPIEENN